MTRGLIILFLAVASFAQAQLDVNWKQLSDVTFEDKYLPDLDAYHWYPTFGEKVLALDGEKISITGYVIPVDYESNYYILSANPYASCFFCGNAGPETVIELELKEEDNSYTTDQRLMFKGTLRLNADDIYKMNYILEEAEVFDY